MDKKVVVSEKYPTWVCMGCGIRYGKGKCGDGATWHEGKCDICGEVASVTEPRDFGHLNWASSAHLYMSIDDIGDKDETAEQEDWAEMMYGGMAEKIKEDLDTLYKDPPRSYNIGESDYAEHKIQPWDIWLEYDLNPWDADIVKRVLRTKKGNDRSTDYEKIIHICKERIWQLKQSS